MTLEAVDLLAIAGIVLASALAVIGSAVAWLRSDIAQLVDRLRATSAKVDALTWVLLAGALARGPLAAPPERTARPSAGDGSPGPTPMAKRPTIRA